MYKFTVVTDPDTAAGFRLAGVDVIEVDGLDEAKRVIPDLLFQDDSGIVAVNEDFMQVLDDKLMSKIEKTYRPIILPIPVRKKGAGGVSYIEKLLRRAIGYNIVLRR
ncbi:MAG TPA: V-type ATP synthase subunit F [Methanoregulaceae archaeon]|nr:V-type ATP synthase subunit F [Methanoregulaceae archaeon]